MVYQKPGGRRWLEGEKVEAALSVISLQFTDGLHIPVHSLNPGFRNVLFQYRPGDDLHIHAISIPYETTHEDISMELESACNF